MNKSQIAQLNKISGILVNMMIFPVGLLILPSSFAASIESVALPNLSSHWYLLVLFLLAFAIGIPLRKYHDKLEKAAKRESTARLVLFRASVIAIYGAVLSCGLFMSSDARLVGCAVGVVMVLLVILLAVAARRERESA